MLRAFVGGFRNFFRVVAALGRTLFRTAPKAYRWLRWIVTTVVVFLLYRLENTSFCRYVCLSRLVDGIVDWAEAWDQTDDEDEGDWPDYDFAEADGFGDGEDTCPVFENDQIVKGGEQFDSIGSDYYQTEGSAWS